jgi:hypothetical protein
MRQLINLGQLLTILRHLQKAKSSNLATPEQLAPKVLGELSMVHQSLELQKLDGYLMVSLVSAFQAGEAQRYYGADLNLVQRTLEQFPTFSGRFGKGSRGYFIFPTLRKIQPELTFKYIRAMNSAIREWAN